MTPKSGPKTSGWECSCETRLEPQLTTASDFLLIHSPEHQRVSLHGVTALLDSAWDSSTAWSMEYGVWSTVWAYGWHRDGKR